MREGPMSSNKETDRNSVSVIISFGFGAEDKNLNCLGKFRFRPNIGLNDIRLRFGFGKSFAYGFGV